MPSPAPARPDIRATVLAALFLALATLETAAAEPFYEPDAVLINITEQDLNTILQDAFHGELGTQVEGREENAGKGLSGLVYSAGLSAPALELIDGGRALLSLSILEADVRLEQFRRRSAVCENLGIVVEPDRPVDLQLDLGFSIVDGDLSILPNSVRLGNSRKGFRLVKPSRCTHRLLPRWLLWWLGKPYLRRYLDRLDELLLDQARRSASELAGEQGLIRKHWRGDGGDSPENLHLYPQRIDTAGGRLRVSFAGSSAPGHEDAGDATLGLVFPSGSYFAISERFANRLLALSMPGNGEDDRRPGGHLGTLLRKSSAFALIPGLRGIARDDAYFSVRFNHPPTVEFGRVPGSGDRAQVRVRFSGIELEILERGEAGDRLLGQIEVRSGDLTVAPYQSVIGGISFELLANDWVVSSSGIEVNEPLLAAALQEIVFSKLLETRIDPVGRGETHVAATEFATRYFSLVGPYLVIDTEFPVQAKR